MAGILNSIKQIVKENTDITVISFDLFDTILFRMVSKPSNIFNKVAEKALYNGCLASHITPEMYRNIRIEAEKKARQIKYETNHIKEVCLEEILKYIPDTICKKKEQLATLELKTEHEFCYLNLDIKNMLPFLQEWKQKGNKIIIISDMYLSAKQERELLEVNGIDTKLFDYIFVSNECLCTKEQGDLYTYVLKQLGINPANLLHIGDNYMSDIVNAQHIGIEALHYDIFSSYNYMGFQIEEMRYGNIASEILSLRKYVSDKCRFLDEEYKKWFQIGAMIMGPFMTDMTEWILNIAEKEKIFNIYPLMREGMIFSKLLNQAIKYRERKFEIRPLYISRKSIFLPSIKNYNKKFIDEFLLEEQGTLKDLFDLFEISVKGTEIENYLSENIKEFKSKYFIKNSFEEKIYKFLCSEETIKNVNQSILKSRNSLMLYLENELELEKQYITVDIGYKGTIQKGLETVLKGYHGIHLLGFGTKDCLNGAFESIDFRGYASMYGDNNEIANKIVQNAYLLEQLLMASCGTTIGYQDNKPIVTKETLIGEKQKKWIEYCQLGMLYYQKKFLYLKYNLEKKDYLNLKKEDLVKIIMRMISYPTLEEGKILGKLLYDENFKTNEVKEICPQELIKSVSEQGVDNFINTIVPGQIKWVEGLIVQAEPGYFIDKILEDNDSLYEKAIIKIIRNIKKEGISQVIVVGAGTAGRTLKRYFEFYNIVVEAFTDNNKKLQGTLIEEVPVKTLNDSFESKSFVIGSFTFVEELVAQVKSQQGENSVIFHA